MGYTGMLLESLKQMIFKLSALVMMQTSRETIFQAEIVENQVSCGLATFVSGWVGLCKTGKVVDDYKDVFKAPFTSLEMYKVN